MRALYWKKIVAKEKKKNKIKKQTEEMKKKNWTKESILSNWKGGITLIR